jgi:NIPSNAP
MIRALSLAAILTPLFAATTFAAPKSRVYELRAYHANPGKLDALHARFRDHTCKLFQKHGMELIGFWTPMDDKNGKGSTLYYILAFPDRDSAKKSWDAFRADPDWMKAKADSEKDGALVGKVESTFLDETDYTPPIANAGAQPDKRVYELRTYVASPGKLENLHKRFRDHTIDLFKKHGMTSLGYWVPQDEAQGHNDTLIYLLAYPSREAATASWKGFGSDPAWQKVYKESQPDNIPLAAKVVSVYLSPTDYPK